MSLLLDALKDADGRRNTPVGATAATASAPRPGNETQVLSILEDPPPGQPPAAAIPRADAAPPGRIEQPPSERPTRRPLAGGAGKQQVTVRRLALPLLLVVTILGIGSGYLYLAGNQD